MRSILVPEGSKAYLVNDKDYGSNEMISYVEKSFSCLGATKFNQAIAV
jgi:hypothetical protein